MSATFVIHVDDWLPHRNATTTPNALDPFGKAEVNDHGGAHVHGAVNDYVS
jgi:hypothetical protein